jgi:ADP-heptose:LPS heptosyltransferase
MRNKEWVPGRFQAVVNALRGEFNFVQIGATTDPVLEGALDLRGRTSLRETAAVLSASLAFVGLASAPMHIARSVNCRAVIVYGGRELPLQSGYSCNENIVNQPPCAPCWQRNLCAHDHTCMTSIAVGNVVEAIRRQSARHGSPLAVDTAEVG